MQALKFDDAKNTTFTVTVSFTLPAKQASGKFNANLVATDQSKSDYMCLDVKYAFAAETMAAVEDEFYLHAVDEEDHKCFEASSSSKFASKGITLTGKCPASYNTLDKSVVVEQCPDGVTSIRYCSPINVTIDTKGQAMMAAVEGTSAYCQIEPDEKPPYFCHAPAEPINCKTDSDCVTPWYNSFCMNDATKKAPYLCKVELPPTCKSDKDCQRSVLSIEEAVEDEFYLHAVDVEDHKCFEASSSSKFASKGITLTGKCPASYNTVDKSVVVEQCPDGVTSIRYCSPINVTIDTKGQAMMNSWTIMTVAKNIFGLLRPLLNMY